MASTATGARCWRLAQRRGGSGGAGRGGRGGTAVALLHRLTETKFLRRHAGSMERGLARRGRAHSGEVAEVQGTAPVDVDEARRSCCRSTRRSPGRRRRDLAAGPRQQGGAAMAGPDGSGRGRRWRATRGRGGAVVGAPHPCVWRREGESGGRKRRGGPSGTASERGGDRAFGSPLAARSG